MFRRVLLGLLAVAAVGYVVFGSSDRPAPVPPGVTVVDYWEKWTGAEGEQMRQVVDDFNATVGRQKHVFVRYLSMADIEQKTLVSVAAGVPPDVAGLYDQQVPQYAALGAIRPLDDLAAAHGITGQTYAPVYWNACHYDGKLYSLISAPAVVGLVWNKAVFAEAAGTLRAAGCDPSRPPRTIAELDRYSKALDTLDSRGQLDRVGSLPTQGWYTAFDELWFGGTLYDPATRQFHLDAPETLRAFEWIKSYSDRLGTRTVQDFANSHPQANFDTPQNPLLTGKLVMQQHGPWVAEYFARLAPGMSTVKVPKDREGELADRTENYAWGMAAFPAATEALVGTTYCPFDSLVIPVGARHPAEAFEFMAYLTRQDVAEKFCALHCTNTPLRTVSGDFVKHHPNPYVGVLQQLAAGPNAHGVPPVPIWPEVSKTLQDAVEAVSLQNADPAAVLHAAQQRVQAKLDQFYAIEARRKARR